MNLIDTHTHLFSSQFDEDRHQVVQKAIEQGVDKMLLPNINSETIEAMNQLCQDFPQHCYPMIGLHPCDVKDDYEQELEIVKSHLNKGDYVAVGEIGIDLYWDKSTLDIQKKAFLQQLTTEVTQHSSSNSPTKYAESVVSLCWTRPPALPLLSPPPKHGSS